MSEGHPGAGRATSVLIVDDEPHARAGIRRILVSRADFAVVGECGDGREAVRAIIDLRPDLVLLDVQMPAPDGFGVLRAVAADRLPQVVFVTAFDDYAVRAFEAHAVDYVLKPFSDQRLLAAMERARDAIARDHLSAIGRRLLAVLDDVDVLESNGADRIVVRSIGRTQVVPVADVAWIEASDYCVRLHTATGAIVHRESLQALERRLEGRFVRAHRSALVQVALITEVRSAGRDEHELVLRGGHRVRVSRTRWPAVDAVLRRWQAEA